MSTRRPIKAALKTLDGLHTEGHGLLLGEYMRTRESILQGGSSTFWKEFDRLKQYKQDQSRTLKYAVAMLVVTMRGIDFDFEHDPNYEWDIEGEREPEGVDAYDLVARDPSGKQVDRLGGIWLRFDESDYLYRGQEMVDMAVAIL